MEGFWAVFGASWRAFGRSLGPCCGHVGVLGDGFGGFGSRWETFVSSWRYFEVLREGFRGFRSYFTGFKRFPQCFYRFPSMLQVYKGSHSVFAAMASKASPVGERSELRWRAKRAPCGLLFFSRGGGRQRRYALKICSFPHQSGSLVCRCFHFHGYSLSIMHNS